MCGIVGFSAYENKQSNYNHLLTLMLANIKRGVHATGIFYGEEVIKSADIADVFLSKHKIKESNIFIGHVRQASIGNKTSDANAHPFEHEHAVGVHNGTLKYWVAQANKLKVNHTGIIVDSDFLIKALSEDRKDGNPEYDVLTNLDGAASLIWADRSDLNYIYVYKNGDRPLFSGETEDGVYFSSTEESLALINAKNIKSLLEKKVFAYKNGIVDEEESRLIVVAEKATTTYSGYQYNGYYDAEYYGRNRLPANTNSQRTINFNKSLSTSKEKFLLTKDIDSNCKAGLVVDIEFTPSDLSKKAKLTYHNDRLAIHRDVTYGSNMMKLTNVITSSLAIVIKPFSLLDMDDDSSVDVEVGTLVFVAAAINEYNEPYVECVNLENNDLFDVKKSYLSGIEDSKAVEVLTMFGFDPAVILADLGLQLDSPKDNSLMNKVDLSMQKELIESGCVDANTSLTNSLIEISDITSILDEIEGDVGAKEMIRYTAVENNLFKASKKINASIKLINTIKMDSDILLKALEKKGTE